MLTIQSDIRELALLRDIEAISARYQHEFGLPPINISSWDPSGEIVGQIPLNFPRLPYANGVDYIFSYQIRERSQLVTAFGFDSTTNGCLVTHSGSAAIVAVAHWLRSCNCKHVLIIGPRYFTVPYALQALGVTYSVVYSRRDEDGYSIPDIDEELLDRAGAIWITNPIYCTSVDYRARDLEILKNLIHRPDLFIIIDECLAEPGRHIGMLLADAGTVIAIYAPHKAVCINGVKFAAVVFPKSEQEYFDAWTDVWNGCLPISSIVALQHFLSADFEAYRAAFREQIKPNHQFVRSIVGGSQKLNIDCRADGYLVSIFVPSMDAELGRDAAFIEKIARETGALFIAGVRNELDLSAGLSFRVNLSALDAKGRGALARLCSWLETNRLTA